MNQKFKVALLSSMVLAACSVNAQNLVFTGNSSSNAPISVAVDISQGNEYGIDLSNGATVTLDGPSISISLTGASNTGWIEGVESRGASSLLNLGGAQTKNINVSVNVDSSKPPLAYLRLRKER
jgi:hypothetical protein